MPSQRHVHQHRASASEADPTLLFPLPPALPDDASTSTSVVPCETDVVARYAAPARDLRVRLAEADAKLAKQAGVLAELRSDDQSWKQSSGYWKSQCEKVHHAKQIGLMVGRWVGWPIPCR
eukprot:2052313-Pyramimonas_sp.AAC.1